MPCHMFVQQVMHRRIKSIYVMKVDVSGILLLEYVHNHVAILQIPNNIYIIFILLLL